MKDLLFEIERFLRWLADMSAEEKQQNSADISEAAQVFAEQLEPIVDSMDDTSEEVPPESDL